MSMPDAEVRGLVWNHLTLLIADHPMWIGDDGKPLDYSPEREDRIGDFIAEATDEITAAVTAARTHPGEPTA